MGLLDLFKKKDPAPGRKDLVWISSDAKRQGCLQLVRENPDALLIAWFDDTLSSFEGFLNERHGLACAITRARLLTPGEVAGRLVIFLEHYPLRQKETELIRHWKPKEILVLNALDEPLFRHFGGDRILAVVQQLGMSESESLQHPLISNSIERAQQKLAQQVRSDQIADSAEEWFGKIRS